jgi:hypothetical protein
MERLMALLSGAIKRARTAWPAARADVGTAFGGMGRRRITSSAALTEGACPGGRPRRKPVPPVHKCARPERIWRLAGPARGPAYAETLRRGVHFSATLEVAMAKAKRERRNSIRTMPTDSSALDALESLERAERSAAEAERTGPEPETSASIPVEVEKE